MPIRLITRGSLHHLNILLTLGLASTFAPSLKARQIQTTAASEPVHQHQTVKEMRFAVAHQHSFSWCYGYLYVSQDKVRYEVVQPQSNRNHSFEVPRTEVTVHQWTIVGQPQDAIELKANGATYRMRWLGNEAEVATATAKRMSPPVSQPPASLISAIQNPASVSVQVTGRGASPDASEKAPHAFPAGSTAVDSTAGTGTDSMPTRSVAVSEENTGRIPPGKLQGVYVCTGGADGQPTNKQYIFYPDGFMVYGIPQEGMIGFDFERYRSEDNRARNWVGRYQLDGDKVRIVWQNQFGDPARPVLIKINETSAHPAWDAGWDTFTPMCRCTGKKFSGTYRWGAPAADQYLQFFADGTFIDHRVTDQMIVPNSFYLHPRIQRGTYSIERQTILFTFADGHRGMRTFVAPKAQENQQIFDWIGLGWHQLFEEGYRERLQAK